MEIFDHIREEDLIKEIHNGEKSLFRLFYIKEKKQFTEWSTHRFSISEKKSLKLYHKSFLKLYETIACKKILNTQFSINQTLYSISKVLMKEDPELKADLTKEIDEENLLPDNILEILFRKNGWGNKPEIKIKAVWDSLDTKCQSVIRQLYFENLEPEIIASDLGLEDPEEVMNLKEECFKKFFKVL